jgi:hypothetical protein
VTKKSKKVKIPYSGRLNKNRNILSIIIIKLSEAIISLFENLIKLSFLSDFLNFGAFDEIFKN